MLWAFAHTGYVTDPIILRGIELTIEAVILGLFFLRFGLFVTIMSHFVYNAGLGALPLLRSSDPYFVFSGLIVIAAMFVPILPGVIKWLQRRAHPIVSAAEPQIDLVTPGDVDRLVALDIKDAAWPAWLSDPSVVAVCARTSPGIVGVAAGKIEADGTTRILTTYVDPQWRRQYLGSELLDHLADVLRERGAKSMQATIQSRDERGIGFFAGQGWRQRVRVYSRSLLRPEARPKGWRNVVRGWVKRLKSNSIN
jgi:ribosomal protein S18 acetylase RimI-like enzyme